MPTTYPPPGIRKTKISGLILIGASSVSQTATVAAWDVTKADLRLLGYRTTSGAGVTGSDSVEIKHTNSTTITAERVSNASGLPVEVSYELTLFS